MNEIPNPTSDGNMLRALEQHFQLIALHKGCTYNVAKRDWLRRILKANEDMMIDADDELWDLIQSAKAEVFNDWAAIQLPENTTRQ